MQKNKLKVLILPLFAVFLLAACGGGAKPPAETAARGFMEAYYVKADLSDAAGFSDGLALERVKTSQSLREGLTVDPAAHQPKVNYKLLKSRVGPDEAEFLYEVEFRPAKSEAVKKNSRIIVRLREGGRWKVTQFSDHDVLPL